MGNIGYIIKRLGSMNYKAMLEKTQSIHKKTGRSRIWLLRDMVRCASRYGAGYMDYDLYEMYDLTHEQRDTYLTRGRNNALILKYNDKEKFHIFDNKDEFYANFDDCLRRQWLLVKQWKEPEIRAFLEKNPIFIAKPIDGSCGRGVERVDQSKFSDTEAVLKYLKELGDNYIIEELIRQHPAVSSVYPEAINTVRVVSIYKDGVSHIICAYFRIGNDGKHVDNFNSGGMVAPVDEATGVVRAPAIDKTKKLYAVHPYTGKAIEGFQFPDWEEALELVRKAAARIEGMAYIGWDVAFTDKGPVIVEGNNFPGHDIYQLPEHTPDRIGMMPKFNV